MKAQKVILLLGGNKGNVKATLASAIALIEKSAGRISGVSALYKTGAWGPVPQDDFLNIAVSLNTIISPGILMKKLLDIEKQFGRKREIKYGPRTLDIDILFYGRKVIRTTDLTVPHPEIQNRRFALIPSCDIDPGFVHPVLNKTLAELLKTCPDTLEVKKWKY